MRGRMNDTKSYAPPFTPGKPFAGGCVAKVIDSNNSEAFKEGSVVSGALSFVKY
jgi:NADPH-dependent curcumin reductase CurA